MTESDEMMFILCKTKMPSVLLFIHVEDFL